MNIIPGEPVPPGFEDEVNRVAEIQQAIDQYKGNALIGLEYTLELHEEDRSEPGYMCVLCDKRGDPRTIMQHWTSFNHRLRYLEKHFGTAVREFNPVRYKPNSHNIMIIIVQSLAEAIEDHHGRLTLSVYGADEFRRQKSRIVNEVNAKFHYDERNGPNFLNVIDRTLWENSSQPTPQPNKMDQTLQITIKAPKRINSEYLQQDNNKNNRDGLDEISSDSDGNDASKKSRKLEQPPAYRVLPRVRRSPPFEEEREKESDKKLPTPKELSMQASHIAQERYKWEKYRCMLEIQLKQMEKLQQDYEKNPEKHPLYPEEWKKFWNRRYKELQAEKKTDPNKYDYKPEWIAYWTRHMKDLFIVEVEKKKKEIKLKLDLPEDAEEKVDQLKEKYKVQVAARSGSHILGKIVERMKDMPSRGNGRDRPKAPAAVIDISDDDDSPRHRRRSSRSRSHSRRSRSNSPHSRRDYKRNRRTRSRSKSPRAPEDYERLYPRHRSSHGIPPPTRSYPPAEEYYGSMRSRYPGSSSHYGIAPPQHYRVLDSHKYPRYEHSPSPNSKSASVKEIEPEPEDEGPLTVVAVLRLLTALEDHLGSLGPKVVDLLGKALSLEKVKANSADDLLTNDDHCVFFETIKEKLKGLLIADVLEDQQKVRAVKKAIKNIAAIVHQVTTKDVKADNKDDSNSGSADKKFGQKKQKNNGMGKRPTIQDLPFDRQVVSTKLAAALVMQGREDVSTEDMDKLIYMFLLMVKLSKNKLEIDGQSLHTKDMLPELGLAVAPVTPSAAALAALPGIVDDLLEHEVTALVQEVEDEISNDTSDKDFKNDSNTAGSMLESLTDSDLQTLLQNFKHLSTEEQHHLIAHLKKLETADPARVEKLRKFVNLTDLADIASTSTSSSANQSKPKESASTSRNRQHRFTDSPAASSSIDRRNYAESDSDRRRGATVNVNPNKFSLDDEDEDDDYNFEDVFKAASSNVNRLSEDTSSRQSRFESSDNVSAKDSQSTSKNAEPIVPVSSSPNALTFNPAGLNSISLSDTQNLIANLMGSLQQSNANQQSSSTSSTKVPQPVPPIVGQQQQQGPSNLPFYQQQNQPQQQQSFAGGYNQMGNPQAAAYYNAMGGGYNNPAANGAYNNPAANGGYPPYQQWGNNQPMQGYGMQQFAMTPQQQQQQQQQQQSQQMGYNNMGYGRGGN